MEEHFTYWYLQPNPAMTTFNHRANAELQVTLYDKPAKNEKYPKCLPQWLPDLANIRHTDVLGKSRSASEYDGIVSDPDLSIYEDLEKLPKLKLKSRKHF